MLYRLLRPFIKLFVKISFNPKIEGIEKIPSSGPIILAGNHTNNFDCLLLIAATKRPIYFLGKHTLFKGIKKYLFKAMHVIPVDRNKKRNREAISQSIETLKKGNVLGIFPEGTINRTEDIIMPFKMGAVYLSSTTHANIIPFVIKGKYKRKGKLKLEFLDSYNVSTDDLSRENEKLMSIVREALGGTDR